MTTSQTLRVLVLAPACDGTDVGEAWCAHQWVQGLAERHQVTLLTSIKRGRLAPSKQLRGIEVIEWEDLPLVHRWERLNSMLKPGYVRYYANARRWLREQLRSGRRFDIAHQFTPIALRYPSPAAGMGVPLIMGPLAGSLETPAGFVPECGSAPWYTRLRSLDAMRMRRDPLLRRTYSSASVVVGVAPYVRSLLSEVPIKRFEVMSELGIHDLAEPREPRQSEGGLRLAHIGRVIRTKGLRDVVRAIGALRDVPGITLESAGEGEDLEACRREAQALGVADRITFHGRIPRERVEQIYRRADAFVFPSFREPSGSVIFESLRQGLPVITTDRGGPAHIVDDSCGIRVPASTPRELAESLAAAIVRLLRNPEMIRQLSDGGRARMKAIGLWPSKVEWVSELYRDVLTTRSLNEVST